MFKTKLYKLVWSDKSNCILNLYSVSQNEGQKKTKHVNTDKILTQYFMIHTLYNKVKIKSRWEVSVECWTKLRYELYKPAKESYEGITERPCYCKRVDPKITTMLLDCFI